MALASGCGGAAPLLHGAHALSSGTISAGAGFAGQFAAGEASAAVEAARAAERTGAAPDEQRAATARAGAVMAAMAPAVSPWASARVGIPGDNEAGLSYTGRGVRLDGRHAFEGKAFALSIGAGASAVLPGFTGNVGATQTEFRTAIDSFGFDVPVLVGWRSTAGVVSLWAGARGGAETVKGQVTSAGAPGALHGDLDLDRWYAGAVIGMAIGFRHVHGALELDTFYQSVKGAFGARDVGVSGVTLAPAGAIIVTF